jgi:DNA invertase Pin-like site-specific DNA recombinase
MSRRSSSAKREGFVVVEWFEEAETAKQVGRTEFGRMLKVLKAKKDVRDILVEKTDRLYRNIADWAKVDDIGCEIHFVNESTVVGPGARSGEKFIHGIKVLMAKNYSENLSEEARKGMGEKAAQGQWPTVSPLGYLNDKTAPGAIVIDWQRVRIVRGIFEQYGSGRMSIRDVTEWAYEQGLRSKKGNREAGPGRRVRR